MEFHAEIDVLSLEMLDADDAQGLQPCTYTCEYTCQWLTCKYTCTNTAV